MSIDYERILKPQEDLYDVQIFKQIKLNNGYGDADYIYPETFLKFHGKVAVFPVSPQDKYLLDTIDFNPLSQLFNQMWSLGYNNFRELVDFYVPNLDQNENYSGYL